ncbi:hypothetical protein KKC94_05400 [Patescibacteria group bacterium]|nr:hypothetical protein [Patescibacteria group bacterium]
MVKLNPVPDLSPEFNRIGELAKPWAPVWDEKKNRYRAHPYVEKLLQDVYESCLKTTNPSQPDRSHNRIVKQLEALHLVFQSFLEQLENNPFLDRMKGDENFNKGGRTASKTAQECLCPGPFRIRPRHGHEQEELKAAVIAPLWLESTDLDNLGLEDHKAPPRAKIIERTKAKISAIPAVREVLLDLEPVFHQGKELRFRKGAPGRMLKVSDGPKKGMVFIAQRDNDLKKSFTVTDIHAAERRLVHIDKSYTDEVRLLQALQNKIEDIHICLDDWRTLTPADEEGIKTELKEIIDQLKNVEDIEKVAILDQVMSTLPLKDRKGRNNPRALQARLVATNRRFSRRRDKIGRISGHLGTDAAILTQLLASQDLPLEKFMELIESFEEDTRQLNLFRGTKLDEKTKEKIKKNLARRKTEMQEIQFQPHLSYAQTFIAQADQVIRDLDLDQDGSTNFLAMYLTAKLKQTHSDILDIYRRISICPDLVHTDKLKAEIEALFEEFKARRVQSQRTFARGSNMNKVFGVYYHIFNGLLKELRENPDNKNTAFENMKTRINNCNFIDLIQSLAISEPSED